ncbi:MAG: PIN domain-containing protein [Phycisphaerales bacterium]|nr:MAG: PIN domain-containing protein [Phycisphaerales bacterium]
MTCIFADTSYWFALLDKTDEWHDRAVAAQSRLAGARLVTTDEVLGEFLNLVSARANRLRGVAADWVVQAHRASDMLVEVQTRASFDGGLELYRNRLDKAYSWVDCVSFVCMRRRGITDALTRDERFEQEGSVALLRSASP